MTAQRHTDRGFSMAELIVVMVIIGIISAIAFPTYINQKKKSYRAAAEADVRQVSTALVEMYGDVILWGEAPTVTGSLSADGKTMTVSMTNTNGDPTAGEDDVPVSLGTTWVTGRTPRNATEENPELAWQWCVVLENNGQYAKTTADAGVQISESPLSCL